MATSHKILPSEIELMECLKKEIDVSWDSLNLWERGFMEDMITRYDVYGDKLIISKNQVDCLIKISDKVL